MVTVSGHDEFDEGDKSRRIRRNLEDPRVVLKQIGVIAEAESARAFREQRYGDDRWPARAPVNVFGILADFAKAGTVEPPKRRFEPRPALMDTGLLSKSVKSRPIAPNVIEVGTPLRYAGVHQHGGPTRSERITQDVQTKLAAWLKGDGADHRNRLGWLLSPELTDTHLEGNVPARPFVGLTKRLQVYVRRAMGGIIEVDR